MSLYEFTKPNEEESDDYVYIDQEFEMSEYENGHDGDEVALCVLAAINCGEIKKLTDLEQICENTVRCLDFVIEHQDYPMESAKKMLKRRSLGIGVTNLAYYLAKNKSYYESTESLELVDELFEHIQYYLLKASCKLAQEFGACEYFDKTTYSQGILPIDRQSKNAKELTSREYECDWESLRSDIKEFGLRNSVLTAIMPCESCQSIDTNIIMADDSVKSFKEIFNDNGFDDEAIENLQIGWYDFPTPINVKTMNGESISKRFYYNGKKPVYEIEMEDGNIFKMTANHKLLVNRDNTEIWVRADELNEDDDIVNINE